MDVDNPYVDKKRKLLAMMSRPRDDAERQILEEQIKEENGLTLEEEYRRLDSESRMYVQRQIDKLRSHKEAVEETLPEIRQDYKSLRTQAEEIHALYRELMGFRKGGMKHDGLVQKVRKLKKEIQEER